MLEHFDHLLAESGIFVVQSCHISPLRNGRNDFPIGILFIKLWMLHQDTVPGRVIGNDVNDDFEIPFVGLHNEFFQICRGLDVFVGLTDLQEN